MKDKKQSLDCLSGLKILHTPFNEANNPFGLSVAERILGVDSRVFVFRNDGYFFVSDRKIFGKNIIVNELTRWIFVLYAICRFSHFHYNFGTFMSPPLVSVKGRFKFLKKAYNYAYALPLLGVDAKLAKLCGVKISVTFQGSDARMMEFSSKEYKWHFAKDPQIGWSKYDDLLRQKKIDIFDQTADYIYSVNPDLLNTLPRRSKFISYSSVFSAAYPVSLPEKRDGILRVAHAPSNRRVKGTSFIFDAINSLREEGLAIELVLVEKVSNVEALAIYEGADVVIDQLLAGWYGAFAVEAMAMGKPVICYIRDDDLVHIPKQMAEAIPILNSTPDQLTEVLRSIYTLSVAELKKLGMRSRGYVENWHNPFVNAEVTIKDYLAESTRQTESKAQ